MSELYSTTPTKPSKPSPDFPLFAQQTRRWAKQIKGTMHRFGRWHEPERRYAGTRNLSQGVGTQWVVRSGLRAGGHAPDCTTSGWTDPPSTTKVRWVDKWAFSRHCWTLATKAWPPCTAWRQHCSS